MIKGRGSQKNTANKFHNLVYDENVDSNSNLKTSYTKVFPKSILNKVSSPDIPVSWSINPYQGCEHGCVYCYARNSHTFLGHSAGLDFESKIFYKDSAVKLLKKKLQSKNWKADTIMLSGNTDCYQPIEQKLEITKGLLELLYAFRHPTGIITKNSLVTRDIKLLQAMAKLNLIRVCISITSMNEQTKNLLEPRTVSIKKRFETVKKLSSAGIPVHVMIAPIIPGLTDFEILAIAKESKRMGALAIGYTMIRLNGDVAEIFEDWARKAIPV